MLADESGFDTPIVIVTGYMVQYVPSGERWWIRLWPAAATGGL